MEIIVGLSRLPVKRALNPAPFSVLYLTIEKAGQGSREQTGKREGPVLNVFMEHIDINRYIGSSLRKICLSEHLLEFHLGSLPVIEIEEYWELCDSSGKVLDRAMGNKLRDSSSVHELLGAHLVACVQEDEFYILNFDNQLKFKIKRKTIVKENRDAYLNALGNQMSIG